jgi:polyribonucleotide nucleotidyltransferase
VIRVQEEMREQIGKAKADFPLFTASEDVVQAVKAKMDNRLEGILGQPQTKEETSDAISALKKDLREELGETYEDSDINEAFEKVLKSAMRKKILDEGVRVDGRDPTTIRPISCEVGFVPRTHGSALFTRGETQAMTLATLGSTADEQKLEGIERPGTKSFLHHYNFPPFSTGETWPLRSPKRREIGHGALAERALVTVVPDRDEFPYTIRLVSEVLSSNGSTSMASTCASSMALMDAGVPVEKAIGGIAMGLITEGDRYVILTDIQGIEDALGDMDFKVTGSREGITALQMDIKVAGITQEIMRNALAQAREGRLFILDRMAEAIAEPRSETSAYAPRITVLKINPEKIGAVIGPGGKTIRGITEETEAEIDIEEDGTVFIAAPDQESGKKAESMVRALTEEAELGKIYTGTVVRTAPYGAFVEILPKQEGLVHISQLADYRVPSVEDVVKVGDEIMVMVTNIDREGKIRLSRQAVLEGWSLEEARERDRKPKGRSRSRRNR